MNSRKRNKENIRITSRSSSSKKSDKIKFVSCSETNIINNLSTIIDGIVINRKTYSE